MFFLQFFIIYSLSILVTLFLALKLIRYPLSGSVIFWLLIVATIISVSLISLEVYYFINLDFLYVYIVCGIVAWIVIHMLRMDEGEKPGNLNEF